MISTKAERESFRKRLEKLIPQMEIEKIIEHFEKEGMARSAIYANIKRLEDGKTFKEGICQPVVHQNLLQGRVQI